MSPSIDTPLSLRDVVRLQGGDDSSATTRRLRRYLRSIERRDDVVILTSVGKKLVTTMSLLREHVPELFDRRREETLAETIAELQRDIAALQAEVDVLREVLVSRSRPSRTSTA